MAIRRIVNKDKCRLGKRRGAQRKWRAKRKGDAFASPSGKPPFLKTDQPRNSDRMVCGAWLAMDRAWMPSCCLTCSDCNRALSCAILASTRLPMPAVRVSDNFWVKVAWIENFAAPDDSLARAELTLVSEVCSTPIKAEALTWVETVAVDLRVTIAPDNLRFWAWAVMRRVPSEDASACT